MRRLLLPALLCALSPLVALPAQGQVLRSVVVPADAPVAVPPRGQPLPTRIGIPAGLPAQGRAPGIGPAPAMPSGAALAGTAPTGLAAAPAVLLPLAAAMIFGGALAGGGGGGTGAPAVTR
jgi:hypothetical protein